MDGQDDWVLYGITLVFMFSTVGVCFLFLYGLSWFLANLMDSPFTKQEEQTLKDIVNRKDR